MDRFIAAALLIAQLPAASSADAPLRVRTTYGQLQGFFQGNARAFLGVPFAAPPIGDLRFALPAAPSKWSPTLNATHLSAKCVQANGQGNPTQTQSEDCLYLNVFTPRARTPSSVPVLVYIHGGGQNTGCSADFPGYTLAPYAGMMVVVIQYRLNVFGYYLHEKMLASGTSNMGLHDQHMALQWVQANAAAFGGDPTSVLIAGQSSGCSSVGFHLVYPPSWSLYSRVAMQSCAMNDWDPKSQLKATGTALAHSLGCHDNTSVLSCMRGLNTSVLQGHKFKPCYNCLEVPTHPLALMREGDHSYTNLAYTFSLRCHTYVSNASHLYQISVSALSPSIYHDPPSCNII
jgi:para-nitrobenzyl esterase